MQFINSHQCLHKNLLGLKFQIFPSKNSAVKEPYIHNFLELSTQVNFNHCKIKNCGFSVWLVQAGVGRNSTLMHILYIYIYYQLIYNIGYINRNI